MTTMTMTILTRRLRWNHPILVYPSLRPHQPAVDKLLAHLVVGLLAMMLAPCRLNLRRRRRVAFEAWRKGMQLLLGLRKSKKKRQREIEAQAAAAGLGQSSSAPDAPNIS